MSVPDKSIPSRPECIQRLLIPIEKVTCWPKPEVPNNMDLTIGKLRLSDAEENQIVAFFQTLTDGFTTSYPDINTYTGQCKTGGSAATQGNESLILTPPLPPCASVVCGVAPFPNPPIQQRKALSIDVHKTQPHRLWLGRSHQDKWDGRVRGRGRGLRSTAFPFFGRIG
jgi:hypothetical protein